MSFWTHLLRLSFALCWLFALTHAPSAVAAIEDLSTQSVHETINITSPHKKNIHKVPTSLSTALSTAVERQEEAVVLSPHPLPPDVLEAIFPSSTSEDVHTDDEDYAYVEPISPNQLSSEEIESVFPGAAEREAEISLDSSSVKQTEVLSPHPLLPEEIEFVFPGAVEREVESLQYTASIEHTEAISSQTDDLTDQSLNEEVAAVTDNQNTATSNLEESSGYREESTSRQPFEHLETTVSSPIVDSSVLAENSEVSQEETGVQLEEIAVASVDRQASPDETSFSRQQLSKPEAVRPIYKVVRSQASEVVQQESTLPVEHLSREYLINDEIASAPLTSANTVVESDRLIYSPDSASTPKEEVTGKIEIEITESEVEILIAEENDDLLSSTVSRADSSSTPEEEVTGKIEIEITESEVKTPTITDIAEEDSVSYAELPRSLSLGSLPAASTQFRFNGQPLSHLTNIDVETNYRFSNDINPVSLLRGSISLNNSIERSVSADRLLTIEHNGTYFQSETVTQSRRISVERETPEVINGFGIQLSLTGACIDDQIITQERCSYTPAISTLEVDDILDFRHMGRLRLEGEVEEVVTQESLDAIAQPGFQRGANGQVIGLDLLFPNTGTRLSASASANINRTETRDIAPTLTLARRRQVVQMNDQEATLGVTMRGNTWVEGDDSNWLSALLQVASVLLPDASPDLEATNQPANTQVNKNLLLAANNARIPFQGLTLYHSGTSRAATPDQQTAPENLPSANFAGIWLGLSPIRTYKIETQTIAQPVGPMRLVASSSAEGGGDDNETRLQFVSSVNGREFSAEELRDTYIQIYQDFYETNVQTTRIENYTEQTEYKPHISFTGNTTSASSALNYYAGAIVEDKLNLYVGLDFTAAPRNGLSYKLGSIFYTQPDRDYYSQLSASVSKRMPLASNASLSLSGGFNWALDRSNQIGDIEVNSRSSTVYLNATASMNRFSVGAKGTVGGILPSSTRSSLRLQGSVALARSWSLSGFVMPFSNSDSYTRYGTSLSWRTAGGRGPLLRLDWTNNRYGYGRDAVGRELSSNENSFLFTVEL